MRNSGIFETKTHFSQLIEKVMAGESISITRHGQEVARLVPPAAQSSHHVQETIQKIKALSQELAAKNPEGDDMSIREMIEWGRK